VSGASFRCSASFHLNNGPRLLNAWHFSGDCATLGSGQTELTLGDGWDRCVMTK